MPNDWFRFKKFTIQQKRAAMKVGTDGVLLGAWAAVPGPGSRILDVGTGTGLIALMMAQRSRDVDVDALEIDPSSARQAEENFQASPWKDRIQCTASSFQDYSSHCRRRYNQIICNPPYFSASVKTAHAKRNLARHDDSLSLEDFFSTSVVLLKKEAIISLILPIEKENRALELGGECELHCRRLTRVKPTPQKDPRRILLEFSTMPGICTEESLTIETGTRHIYTEQFAGLVDKFYL